MTRRATIERDASEIAQRKREIPSLAEIAYYAVMRASWVCGVIVTACVLGSGCGSDKSGSPKTRKIGDTDFQVPL